MRSFPWLIAAILILGLTALPARADDVAPGRVGRVSLAETGTGLRPNGGNWADAIVNEPVAAGTALRTGAGARAEIRLAGVVITLAPGTAIDIIRLDDETAQIALRQGRIGLALDRRNPRQSVEIDTASGTVAPAAPGQYDIDAGSGLLAGAAGDGFGGWWRSRVGDDPPLDHVPATMPGAAALAANGDWGEIVDDGPVWYPKNLPADWSPYRFGCWRFLPPWGWTWIDDAPWGFAPSHYGRWAQIDERWGWLPGTGDTATHFSPAAVAFLGTPGIGLSYAGGSGPAIAWFPLAPKDSLADGTYSNRRSASAVPRPVFTGGGPVAAALVDIPPRRLDKAPVLADMAEISPPAPRVASSRPVVIHVAAAPHQPIALVASLHNRGKTQVAAAHRPHAPSAMLTRLAAAPTRSEHPHRHFAGARIASAQRPHASSPTPTRMATALPRSDHLHRHVAEARHILRQ